MQYDLGFALWLIRMAQGLTQTQLARKVHTTRQAVGNWETGLKSPTVESLGRLCRGLQVPVNVCVRIAEGRKLPH